MRLIRMYKMFLRYLPNSLKKWQVAWVDLEVQFTTCI